DIVEANALHGGRIPAADTANVVGLTIASNGFGASVGLEAAYAQAGGGLASLIGQRLKLRRNDLRTLVGAGTGAAISAAFGAPLTGAFYAFEIALGAYTPATIAPVMAAALVAAVAARGLGATPYVISAGGMHPIVTADYLLYALLGLICAGVGIALMRLVSLVEQLVQRLRVPRYLAPFLGGLLLIPLALVSPQTLSAGHGALNLTMMAEVTIASLALAILLKIAASAVSLGFGFRGGLFFASLFIGSLVGRLYQVVLAQFPDLHVLAPDDATLVGMAALAVAVVGGPMTISLLVLEVTHDFAITGVAIAASLISTTVVRATFGYSFSTWRLHLRGEMIRSGRDIGWMRTLTAGKLMRRDPRVIRATTSLAAFRTLFPLGSTKRVVLSRADGSYAGIVRTADAWSSTQAEEMPIESLALLRDDALTVDMEIGTIMEMFDRSEADDLAVLSVGGAVVGILTETHVRRRYAEELEKSQRELFGEG
ncbi:MAG: chloride channel protein, partial [Sphingomonas sp.]